MNCELQDYKTMEALIDGNLDAVSGGLLPLIAAAAFVGGALFGAGVYLASEYLN